MGKRRRRNTRHFEGRARAGAGGEERRGEERRRQTNKHNKESIDTRRQPAMALVGPLLAAVGGICLIKVSEQGAQRYVGTSWLHQAVGQWSGIQNLQLLLADDRGQAQGHSASASRAQYQAESRNRADF